MPAGETPNTPLTSPDGRFQVVVEETADRFETLCDTVLIGSGAGDRLFSCRGTPRAEFAADGTLYIEYPGYEPERIQIDPTRGVFRTRSSDPWVPLAAWPMLEAAFGRGWARAMDYRVQTGQAAFPWVSVLLLLGSLAALLALSVLPPGPCGVQKVLLLVAGAGAMFFGWLAAGSLRWRTQLRRLAGAPRPR